MREQQEYQKRQIVQLEQKAAEQERKLEQEKKELVQGFTEENQRLEARIADADFEEKGLLKEELKRLSEEQSAKEKAMDEEKIAAKEAIQKHKDELLSKENEFMQLQQKQKKLRDPTIVKVIHHLSAKCVIHV